MDFLTDYRLETRSAFSTFCRLGIMMVFTLLLDTVLVARLMSMERNGARWFALHSVINIAITVACLPDLLTTLSSPVHSLELDKPYSMLPAYLSMGLHLYHCTVPWYSKTLTFQDYLHHFAFAFALGGIQLAYHWGPGSNLFMFFVTGFPGAMDYGMLACVKQGWMTRIKEKEHNSTINAWIRGPGCVASSAFIYAAWASNKTQHIPSVCIVLTIVLSFTNGQYYAQRVIANYAQCMVMESKNRGKSDKHQQKSTTQSAVRKVLMGPTQTLATESRGWPS